MKILKLFEQYSMEADKKQYLIPYFIAAHPGSRDEDMLQLALWLKQKIQTGIWVQTFLSITYGFSHCDVSFRA